ncbi:hypothetical protein Tco_1447417 [Tanacetum coccineum]
MEMVSSQDVKFMWGNSNYDYVFSEAAGNSGGILCIWEGSFFKKDYVTISDSFVAIYGTWIPSKTKLLVLSGIFTDFVGTSKTSVGMERLLLMETITSAYNVERRESQKSDGRLGKVTRIEVCFMGIINKKRSNLAIRGVFVDGISDLLLRLRYSYGVRLTSFYSSGFLNKVIRYRLFFLFLLLVALAFNSVCKAVDEDVFKGIQLLGITLIFIRAKFWVWGLASRVEDMASSLVRKVSIWSSILKEVHVLKSSGFDSCRIAHKTYRAMVNLSSFWTEDWIEGIFPCVFGYVALCLP